MLVQQAREAHAQGDPHWAAPLVLALDEACPGSSVRWALNILQRILSRQASPLAQEQCDLLANLEEFFATPPAAAELWETSRKTWYHPQRDAIQTALSRLYAALAHQVQGDLRSARREVIDAISVMCNASKVVPNAVDRALACFDDLYSRSRPVEPQTSSTPAAR